MGYITIPNTITTGANILPGPLNDNFTAIADGLSDQTKAIEVAEVTASELDQTNLTVVDRKVQADFYGNRLIIYPHKCDVISGMFGHVFMATNTPAGGAAWEWDPSAFIATRDGSILSIAWHMYITYVGGSGSNAISVSPHINETVVAGAATLDYTIDGSSVGAVVTEVETYSRGAYTFSAGDAIGLYFANTSGSRTSIGSLATAMEFVYDE